jgi:hypothetical protein
LKKLTLPLLHAVVVNSHAGSLRELRPQQGRERFDLCLDLVDLDPHRVPGSHAQADPADDESLPPEP